MGINTSMNMYVYKMRYIVVAALILFLSLPTFIHKLHAQGAPPASFTGSPSNVTSSGFTLSIGGSNPPVTIPVIPSGSNFSAEDLRKLKKAVDEGKKVKVAATPYVGHTLKSRTLWQLNSVEVQ